MQALILAGGKGTRLRPLTVYTPKPIVPVVNKPFLLYQIEILKRCGITDITLSLSYQPDKIQHVLGNGSDHGVSLRYITEPTPMGTGGAYRFASEALNETTVVFNGDIITDLDIQKVIDRHREKGAAATLTLHPVEDPSRYGLAQTDEAGAITGFIEKPAPGTLAGAAVNTINAGIYVLEPAILELIADGENRSFEYDVFPELLKRGMPFFGYIMDGDYWLDIGTPESYLKAHHDFLAGRIKGFDIERTAESDVATRAEVDKASVLGEGCSVKPGAKIINSVVGAGVHIEEKAVIENSVIWAHSRIAASAEINSAIIGRSCHVGRNAVIGEGTVLGDKTSLTDYTRA